MTFADWISSTIATTFLIGMLGFILRHWIAERIKGSIKHEYDKDLEKHKADLKRNYDVEIERLKAELQIANVRFSRIFDEQANAIVETHRRLLPIPNAVEDYTMLMGNPDETEVKKRAEALNSVMTDFFTYFTSVKIYIPKPTAKRLMDFVNTNLSIARKHEMIEKMIKLRVIALEEKLEVRGAELDKLKLSVSPLLEELEKDLQKILGVHT